MPPGLLTVPPERASRPRRPRWGPGRSDHSRTSTHVAPVTADWTIVRPARLTSPGGGPAWPYTPPDPPVSLGGTAAALRRIPPLPLDLGQPPAKEVALGRIRVTGQREGLPVASFRSVLGSVAAPFARLESGPCPA